MANSAVFLCALCVEVFAPPATTRPLSSNLTPVLTPPNFPAEKLLELAFASLAADHTREAEARFRQVLHHDSANVPALTRLALLAFDQGRTSEARTLFARAVEHDPENLHLLAFFGLLLHRTGEPRQALDVFLRALAIDNTRAPLWNAAAVCLQETGQPVQALEFYLRATGLQPHFVEALNNLGILLLAEGDSAAALEPLSQAVAADPACSDAQFNLGVALRNQLRYRGSLAHLREARRLQPTRADFAGGLGEVLSLLYEPEARTHLEDGVRLAPADPEKHWNLALDLLKHGDYTRGWREYEWRWQRLKEKQTLTPFTQPVWTGKPLAGTTLLLRHEQGFGDSVQFLRFLPQLLAQQPRHIFVQVQPALKPLVEQLAVRLDGAVTVLTDGDPLPLHDWHAALMSLPAALGTTLDTIPPPLRLTPERTARPDGGPLRIGLAWAGNPTHNRDAERSLPVSSLAPLFTVPNCTWTSLQLGPRALELFRTGAPIEFPELPDFAATAALLDTLDLVIAADTAVAHLAATQGVPTWLLLPYIADWRWLTPAHTTSPWYPQTRLFRQQSFPEPAPQVERWAPVIAEVTAALAELTTSPR